MTELASDLALIELTEQGGAQFARLTINRPDKANALSPAAVQALEQAARSLHGREELQGVIVTGAGARAFVGGADIGAMAEFGKAEAIAFITGLHRAIAAIRDIPVPTIARVNGYCFGAGLEIAAGCDLRIAADTAVFGMPEVKVGIPSVIEAALLPRLVGWGKAAELLLLGDNIDAETAHRIGLVEKVAPAADLDAALSGWLDSLAKCGAKAVRLQKALLRDWERLPLSEAIEAGIRRFGEAYEGDEPRRMMEPFARRRR